MKLEPVFLLAPRPAPPSMPTRRAFLLAGSTALLGVATGATAGVLATRPPSQSDGTLDAEAMRMLRWARELAQPATPIDELVQHAGAMLMVLAEYAPADAEIWRAVDRLARHVTTADRRTDHAALAHHLHVTIASLPQAAEHGLHHHLAALRRAMR